MIPIGAFLNRLDKVIGKGPQYSARCPANEDRGPSLSIKDAGDRILIHCHAGCHPEDVLTAVGLSWGDLCAGDRWDAARHAGLSTLRHNAFKDSARRAAQLGFDPELERRVLAFTAEDIRQNKPLTAADRARAELASARLDSITEDAA